MKFARVFTAHPASVGETYAQHMAHAGTFGARMVFAGLACLVHAILPFSFINTGSNTVRQLHDALSTRSQRAVTSRVVSSRKAVGS